MTKSFAAFWESIEDKKGAKERADRVLKTVHEYNKKARRVLELGVEESRWKIDLNGR